MQQWFTLSDPAMEEAFFAPPLYREFAKLQEFDRMPDESTILRFRHRLEKHKLADAILEEVNALLSQRGLLLKVGTVVDATLIAAPSSTKNKDQERDPEMHSSKKGQQMYFGMKAHIGADAESGLVHTVNLIGVRQSRTEPQFPHEFPGQTISYNFNKSDLWLAKQSRILLHASHGPTTADLRKMTYRTQAERVGYGKATRIDYFQIAVHLLRRFGRPFVQRILGSFEVDYVTGLVHSTINGGDIGIRPANHILCIEVLFGEQLKFFQALKGHAGNVFEDNGNLSSLHKDEPSTSRVHKKIFLEELALSGRDVMVALDRKFPHTHTWIITNALHWSRRRLSAAFPKRKK